MTNYNDNTGFAYGVLAANNVPDLLDDVLTNGHNLTFEATKQELHDLLRDAFISAATETGGMSAEACWAHIREGLATVLVQQTSASAERAAKLVADVPVRDLLEALTGVADPQTLDWSSLLAAVAAAGLWEEMYDTDGADEYSYEYTTPAGPVKLRLGHLGGAPLLWVIESPYFTRASWCSPCVPGAGDLDNPKSLTAEGGVRCHCLPADDMPDDWTGHVFRVPKG